MADVFISYASEDRERVRPLAEALQARGFSVWWDRALAAGDDYARVIERELSASRAVVVVWTRASTQSAFVRDEAARARDQGRLVPIRLDREAELPLGFGSFQAEDFSGWSGGPETPEVGIISEVLKARLEGRDADGPTLETERKRVKRRMKILSGLGAVAALLAIASALYFVAGRTTSPRSTVEQTAQFERILDLVASGQLTGEQALELAKLMQGRAFDAAEDGADASVGALAAAAFESAATELLQHPDPAVRTAVVKAANPTTRAAGVEEMENLGAQGGANTGAVWRALGALKLANGDGDAMAALERARSANPHDKGVWRMLSKSYAAAAREDDAEAARLIGDGLEAAAAQDWEDATTKLDAALERTSDSDTRGFVLGQLGDVAVAREDWRAAEDRYASALGAHAEDDDKLAVAVDAAKLARAQQKRGDRDGACDTLREAQAQGASVPQAELDTACSAPPGRQEPGSRETDLSAARP
jgi:hypothetical protein